VADQELLAQIMTDRNDRAHGYAIPEGLLADRWIPHLHRDAENLLPRPFREVVEATAHPFALAIRDLASDHMVARRVVTMGDAAAIPRPHTAASTSKAAGNALALVDALQASPADVPAALARWEPNQIVLGRYLRRQGSQTGDYLLYHRPPTGRV
jgi:2-polyprenyl-6-methoxyphenol hydroxylase-like FAD-dependent oxidoreductase